MSSYCIGCHKYSRPSIRSKCPNCSHGGAIRRTRRGKGVLGDIARGAYQGFKEHGVPLLKEHVLPHAIKYGREHVLPKAIAYARKRTGLGVGGRKLKRRVGRGIGQNILGTMLGLGGQMAGLVPHPGAMAGGMGLNMLNGVLQNTGDW